MDSERAQTSYLNLLEEKLRCNIEEWVRDGKFSSKEKRIFSRLMSLIRINSEQLGYYACCGIIHSGYTADAIMHGALEEVK